MPMVGLSAETGTKPKRLKANAESRIIEMVFIWCVFNFGSSFFGNHTGLPVKFPVGCLKSSTT